MSKYYIIPDISNSALAYINPEQGGSPQMMRHYLDGTLPTESKSYLVRGVAIHEAILEPDKFVMSKVIKPSDAVVDIMDALISELLLDEFITIEDASEYGKQMLKIARAKQYQNRMKDDTLEEKLIKEGGAYFNERIENKDSTILPEKDYEVLTAVRGNIDLNDLAVKYIRDYPDEVEAINEQEVYWKTEVNGVTLNRKAKLDRLIIFPDGGFILVDLKTTSKSFQDFPKSFANFKYHRQLSYYKEAAIEYLKQNGYKDPYLKEAIIVAVQTTGFYGCRVFQVDDDFLGIGDQEVKALLERVAYHMGTNDWHYTMEELHKDRVYSLSPVSLESSF